MKRIKKIRRRRRGTSPKLYFSKETQEFIEEYQRLECINERHAIYAKKIFPAFDKLAENLIFVYGFINAQEDYLSLKNDCVSFLYETIAKWDSARGTKAFSYFNVVAKNWLIMNSRKLKKHAMRTVSLADTTSLSHEDKKALANYDFIPSPDEILIKKGLRDEILNILDEIQRRVKGQKELTCIAAIITVFNNMDELDFLNKRAIFIYVRDISGLNPKQLSVAMSTIRKHYRELVHEKNKMGNLL